MSYFKAKMHQNRFQLGLPRPSRRKLRHKSGALQAPFPSLLSLPSLPSPVLQVGPLKSSCEVLDDCMVT